MDRTHTSFHVSKKQPLFMDRTHISFHASIKLPLFMDRTHTSLHVSINLPLFMDGARTLSILSIKSVPGVKRPYAVYKVETADNRHEDQTCLQV